MLNYSDAKDLEEAGFKAPERIIQHGYWLGPLGVIHPEPGTTVNEVYAPTLEELIDAVGDGFHSLTLGEENNWVAMALFIDTGFIEADGSTSIQAVKNLYIALKK